MIEIQIQDTIKRVQRSRARWVVPLCIYPLTDLIPVH